MKKIKEPISNQKGWLFRVHLSDGPHIISRISKGSLRIIDRASKNTNLMKNMFSLRWFHSSNVSKLGKEFKRQWFDSATASDSSGHLIGWVVPTTYSSW